MLSGLSHAPPVALLQTVMLADSASVITYRQRSQTQRDTHVTIIAATIRWRRIAVAVPYVRAAPVNAKII